MLVVKVMAPRWCLTLIPKKRRKVGMNTANVSLSSLLNNSWQVSVLIGLVIPWIHPLGCSHTFQDPVHSVSLRCLFFPALTAPYLCPCEPGHSACWRGRAPGRASYTVERRVDALWRATFERSSKSGNNRGVELFLLKEIAPLKVHKR